MFEKIEDFRNEEKEWNDLTVKILSDKIVNEKLGLIIDIEDLENNLTGELKQKEIINITVSNNEKCKSVEYQREWKYSIGTQYLKWTTCDSVKSKEGYYENLTLIEVFGIGNGWLTWIDTDPI